MSDFEFVTEGVTAAKTLAEWVGRVEGRSARVGVVGLGYVGLPLTLLLCDERFQVTGFDIDAEKVRTLNEGGSYIHRIEPEHIRAAQAAGFRATTDFSEAAGLDAVLICVPTPLYRDHTPDMRAVVGTMEALAPHVRNGQLVVLESTTYPGTTEEIVVAAIERAGRRVLRGFDSRGNEEEGIPQGLKPDYVADPVRPRAEALGYLDARATTEANTGGGSKTEALDGVMVAFSPEREDPGNVTTPRREIPKVVGGVDARASTAACALYGAIFTRTVAMSTPAAAEMTKLLENIYRSVNIALVNEMKQLCLEMGIDIWEVIAAASTKPFGFQAFQPGPGVGGHCIPVDPFYLTWKAKQHGFRTRFIELAGEVNESMPGYVVETTARALEQAGGKLDGAKVLVLGVAYKKDVDDLRESPALEMIRLLRDGGAEISYNDPFFPKVGTGRRYDLRMNSTPLEDLGRFDCIVIATDHSEYDYGRIVSEAKLVIDSRNATRALDAAVRNSGKIVRC